MLHPTVRIASLLAFGAALAGRAPLAATALATLMFGICVGVGASARLRAALRRARWLLLAVFAMHLIATPGAELWPGAPAWVPSSAGLALGAGKIAVLVAMIGAVAWLLHTTSSGALAQGVAGVGEPLRWLGFEPDAFGARAAGALEQVGAVERALGAERERSGWLAAVVAQVVAIEAAAARAAPLPRVVATAPRPIEWALPLALSAGALLGRGA